MKVLTAIVKFLEVIGAFFTVFAFLLTYKGIDAAWPICWGIGGTSLILAIILSGVEAVVRAFKNS